MTSELLEGIGELRRRVYVRAVRAFAAFGLGPRQVALLRYVARHEPLGQGELARATITDPGATARAVDGLVRRGWVERQTDPADRRRVALRLADEGRARLAEVDRSYAELAAGVFAPLTADERAAFAVLVEKLTAALPPAGDEEVEE
jgi:DNA-binding MarR family transcriptional regulator